MSQDLPEVKYTNRTIDARGNVTEERHVAKSVSGLAAIVKTASYDATCSNPKKCNKPNYTIDERGNRTDYTYDATNGEVTRIQLPAATSGGTRPEIRYAYTQYYAQIRNRSEGHTSGLQSLMRISYAVFCLTQTPIHNKLTKTKITT